MNFEQWLKEDLLKVEIMTDPSRMGLAHVGTTGFTTGLAAYDKHDDFFIPDNAEIEFIGRFVQQTAGMYWAFTPTVRSALLHKAFIEALRENQGKPIWIKNQGFNKDILASICNKLRLNIDQCRALTDDHRQDLKQILKQLRLVA